MLSLGVQGVPWNTQILADQLTLFQTGGKYYAHLITTGTPGFSDLPTALTHAEMLITHAIGQCLDKFSVSNGQQNHNQSRDWVVVEV